jgi:hypothetical protein
MQVEGHCQCGRIRYQAVVDPGLVVICHCTDCQSFSGSPYRVGVPAARENFSLEAGTPKIYVKVAASGRRRAQAFCGDCGSAIYAADAEDPQRYVLRVGSLAQRERLPPRRQIWCGSALSWARDIDAVAGADGEWPNP